MAGLSDYISVNTIDFIFEGYPEGMAIVSRSGKVILANTTFTDLTGIGSKSGKRLTDLFDKNDRVDFELQVGRFFFLDEKLLKLSYSYQSVQKKLAWCEMIIKKMDDMHTSLLFILFRDITEERSLQYRLMKERKEAENTTRVTMEVLANTSHELRTPIHTIIGMIELMQDSLMDEEQIEYSSQIKASAEILLSLINDILDYSKIEANKVVIESTPFNLVDLVETAADMLSLESYNKNIDMGVYFHSDVPEQILGDPTRLRKLWLEFCVSDTGIGIPEQKRPFLFSPFQQADSSTTRKYGGTGLGLYICRNLVQAFGGEIYFKNKPAGGTEFVFQIPAVRAEKNEGAFIPGDFYAGLNVLVVDDNSEIRRILVNYLTSWGCSVLEADSGSSAMDLIKREMKEKRRIDLVLADLLMPGGDGFFLASEIRSLPGLPGSMKIIIMLLKGQGAVEVKMLKMGWANGYIKKPVKKESLLNKIFSVLNEDLHSDGEISELVPSDIPDISESPLPDIPGRKFVPIVEKRRNILIAEDHFTNQQLFKTILEKEGYSVTLANNGEEAVRAVENNSFDLIFMDCQMPVLNGLEAAVQIREKGYNVPIVAVTASAIREEKQKCLNVGMNDFLMKPFKRKDLVPVLDRLLSKDAVQEAEPPATETDSISTLNTLPVFDYDDALSTFMGEKEILRGILETYKDKTIDQVLRLKQLRFPDDAEESKALAHSIKGSARNLSMKRLGLCAEIFETALKKKDYEAAGRYLQSLQKEYSLLVPVLNDILSNR